MIPPPYGAVTPPPGGTGSVVVVVVGMVVGVVGLVGVVGFVGVVGLVGVVGVVGVVPTGIVAFDAARSCAISGTIRSSSAFAQPVQTPFSMNENATGVPLRAGQ